MEKFFIQKTACEHQCFDRYVKINIFDIDNSNLNDTDLENQSKEMDAISKYYQNLAKRNGYELVFDNDYLQVYKNLKDDSEFKIVSSKDTSVININL